MPLDFKGQGMDGMEVSIYQKSAVGKHSPIMKNHPIRIATLLVLGSVPLQAAPEPFYEGISLNATSYAGLFPGTHPSGKTVVDFYNGNGGLYLYSYVKETAPAMMDGGITLYGNPVSVVLGTDENWNNGTWDQGIFNVWKSGKWGTTNPADKPIFEINSLAGTTSFDSTNVTVTNGSLKVGGSPVLTEASAPPTSGAWSAAYVTRGNVTAGTGWMAAGDAQATGLHAMARGDSTTVASGPHATAIGIDAVASGQGSFANGSNVDAIGTYSAVRGMNSEATGLFATAVGSGAKANGNLSTATGVGVQANSYAETVVGTYNKLDTTPDVSLWKAQDTVFRVGNGSSTLLRSDALKITKAGKSTVSNLTWRTNLSANGPLYESSDPQADSEALVVEGHARLKGKVIIEQPQGDISMGIYE